MRKKAQPNKDDIFDELFLDLESLESLQEDFDRQIEVIRKRIKLAKHIVYKEKEK